MPFLFLFAFMRLFVLFVLVKFYRKKKKRSLKLPLITSFTILLLSHEKVPHEAIMKKNVQCITKMYNMYLSQRCNINNINLKALRKTPQMIQECYASL